MDSEKINKIRNSIDRIELNLKLSLEEIAFIKGELATDDKEIVPSPNEGFEEIIQEMDQKIEDIINEIDSDSIMDVPKLMEDIDNKIIQLRSERNKDYNNEPISDVIEGNIDRFSYEQIGLQNYIDSKRIVQSIIDKSKEIVNETEDKRKKMLLSMEEGKSLAIKNTNLKTYKEFYNNKLKDLKKKRTECIKHIAKISPLTIAEEDKKYIIEEGVNNLLRFLSYLMLDFSYSKESVNYYNIGRFYSNYEEMKKLLLIENDNKNDFDESLMDLLAVSYQANVMRYEVKYLNNEIVENKRLNTTFLNKKA